MTRATNTTSAAPTLRSLLPSWRLFVAIFAGGLCAGAINGLALHSLGQKPRQPSTQQCASHNIAVHLGLKHGQAVAARQPYRSRPAQAAGAGASA